MLRTPVGLARVVLIVAALNLAYFGVEFAVALQIQSASLFADAVDFFEDAAVAFAWTLWRKLSAPVAPPPDLLSLTALGALAVNLFCAFLLAEHRNHGGSLAKAAFLSARNDAMANVAIIAAAGVTFLTNSAWPDILVGCAIAWMNIDAAREIFAAARGEKGPDTAEA